MSVKVMADIWERNIKPNLKLVLLAYGDHADHDGKNIFPAIPTIAMKTGYSDRTVQRNTKELEELGLLIPDGKGKNNIKKWKYPFLSGDKLTPQVVTSETQVVTSETQVVTSMSPKPSITAKEPSFNPPEHLQTDRFIQTWDDWAIHRKEIKKKLTPSTTSRQLKLLGKYDERTAIAIIERSITNGWQGLFPLDGNNGMKPPAPRKTMTREELIEKRGF